MKTNNKKVDELTSDWIFDTQCTLWFRDENGTGYLVIDNVYYANCIVLAFQKLGIKFDFKGETDENEKDRARIYDFQIADIKDECPIFYGKFMEQAITIEDLKKYYASFFKRNN